MRTQHRDFRSRLSISWSSAVAFTVSFILFVKTLRKKGSQAAAESVQHNGVRLEQGEDSQQCVFHCHNFFENFVMEKFIRENVITDPCN